MTKLQKAIIYEALELIEKFPKDKKLVQEQIALIKKYLKRIKGELTQ
jgi:tRNA isopentenyl-2-thiomethyl-A-37 hydroxylase MiaE